jgi:hypothetical protein
MRAMRKTAAIALILGLGLSQSGCVALAVGAVAGAAIGVTAKGVGMAAKGVGKAAGAVLPGGDKDEHERDDRRR